MTRASNWSGALATCLLCIRTASALPHIANPSILGWNMERPVMEDDSDDALVIMLILISAIFGTILGIAAVFLVLYALVQVVQRVRRFVFRLDDDGMSERM
ncbi:hypothetical protein GGF45_003069, partial [Coemansia sp. RSA 551]